MSTAPRQYITKPSYIEAWQLTEENISSVAKWCNGRVKGLSITLPKIRDRGKPLNPNDVYSYAVSGNYIVRLKKGFKVLPAEEFEKGHKLVR